MRRVAALAALLVAAACQQRTEERPPAPPQEQAIPAQAEMRSPVLLRYKSDEQGGPNAFMAAIVRGVLDFSGPCVRVQDSSGRFRTVVTAAGSRLARDSIGLYWPAGTDRLRHGSSAIGGGGEMPRLPADAVLDGAVPPACRPSPALELIGPQRDEPPPAG